MQVCMLEKQIQHVTVDMCLNATYSLKILTSTFLAEQYSYFTVHKQRKVKKFWKKQTKKWDEDKKIESIKIQTVWGLCLKGYMRDSVWQIP